MPKILVAFFIAFIGLSGTLVGVANVHSLEKIEALGSAALREIGINPYTLTAVDKNREPQVISAADEAQIAKSMLGIETNIAHHIKDLYAFLVDLQTKQKLIAQTLPIAALHCTQEQLRFARVQMGFLSYEIQLVKKLIELFERAANLSAAELEKAGLKTPSA